MDLDKQKIESINQYSKKIRNKTYVGGRIVEIQRAARHVYFDITLSNKYTEVK